MCKYMFGCFDVLVHSCLYTCLVFVNVQLSLHCDPQMVNMGQTLRKTSEVMNSFFGWRFRSPRPTPAVWCLTSTAATLLLWLTVVVPWQEILGNRCVFLQSLVYNVLPC